MKAILHTPAVRQTLRKWRPVYNMIFRRKKDLSRLPAPEESIRQMNRHGVFLFSFGRSGTTVFSDFMASHPEVITLGEVLNEESFYSFYQDFNNRSLWWWSLRPTHMARAFYPYLARLVRKNPGMRCMFDLKIEGLHPIEGNWRLPGPEFQIFAEVLKTDAPILLVERRDLVDRYVSGQVAQARQAFHSYHGAEDKVVEPFAIDIDVMEANNAQVRMTVDYMKKRFADHPRFEVVTYEEMFETDPDSGESVFRAELAERMAALLDVPLDGFDRVPQLKKVGGSRAKSLITNMDEVEAARARQPGFGAAPAA